MRRQNLSEERFRVWLKGLAPERLRALGQEYARLALQGGLAVLQDGGVLHVIPPALTPAVEEPEKLAARSALARSLLSGLVKLTRYVMAGAGRAQADSLLAGLSSWERELCNLTWRSGEFVAIARADLFTDRDGVDRPLEMNATIPAMQAYSDVAAQAFIRAVGGAGGLPTQTLERLGRENGSNTDDLRRSLLAHHERLGGAGRSPSLALIARAGDPQSPELTALCTQFLRSGVEAVRCTPDQLRLGDDGRAALLGRPVDILYRHIFARRIEPESALGRIARNPDRHHLFNPVNSHLEMKSLFAELSAATTDAQLAAAIGLDEIELAAATLIPWSRALRSHATAGPDGKAVPDLIPFVIDHPDQLVLKRSWGYGGTSVLLGDEIDSDAGQARAKDILGRTGGEALSWRGLIEACVDSGGYIVQRRVELRPERHLIATDADPYWAEWYVDVSAYTNLGVEPTPRGGVRRGSTGRIVNIVGGGGLVPMLTEPVMEELLAALGV